ncbi:unnamed protein product [Pleuronectes platessa]|uniref:Uncharacterized protein n=1 Tax=Pleuronectes platessa TaxID=8262 RepID=A0A9N7V628_PLEPL|nr:unnamed protein product [Pleuronectes platessa]
MHSLKLSAISEVFHVLHRWESWQNLAKARLYHHTLQHPTLCNAWHPNMDLYPHPGVLSSYTTADSLTPTFARISVQQVLDDPAIMPTIISVDKSWVHCYKPQEEIRTAQRTQQQAEAGQPVRALAASLNMPQLCLVQHYQGRHIGWALHPLLPAAAARGP